MGRWVHTVQRPMLISGMLLQNVLQPCSDSADPMPSGCLIACARLTDTAVCVFALCCFLLQKREQSGDHWTPRFFTPAPGMGILEGEETAEAVPLWAWNGKYSEAKQQPEVQEWEGEPK
jgi:hypothetical protein